MLNSLLILIIALNGSSRIKSLSLDERWSINATSLQKLNCWNGNKCDNPMCKSFDFDCGGSCNYVEETTCEYWCDQNTCKTELSKRCIDCLFCERPGGACPLNTFIDVTSVLFPPKDDYWSKWTHSGRPYAHEGAPVFVDLNNDGRLDYFNSMHGHHVGNSFMGRMELGESVPNNFTKDDTHLIQIQNNLQRLSSIAQRIIIEDDPNLFLFIDTHGQNVVDLDGDGVLDILIASGGNQGSIKKDKRRKYSRAIEQDSDRDWGDNFLLWGEKQIDESTGRSMAIFRGGRGAARMAGVHMREGRGRVNYLLDVNSDGLLDIFCLQDRRIDNKLTPGVLLINQGDRTWKEDTNMTEFARSMMLTDADGDGYAQEIMISRSFCFPEREGPGLDSNFPTYGSFPDSIKNFCSTRPVGTIAIYKFNPATNQMDEISSKFSNISDRSDRQPPCCPHGTNNGSQDCNAISMASADFDGDLLADHIILFQSKMVIYFSKGRAKGELPGGNVAVGAEIKLPAYCSSGRTVRVIDLDNDGVEEIVVMCKVRGTFLVYTRGTSEHDWVLEKDCNSHGSMGALNDVTLGGPTVQDLTELCSKGNHDWKKLKQICEKYNNTKKIPVPKTAGICLVDLDNDGFLDAVVTHNFGYLRFFKNVPSETSQLNRFISFSVKGDGKSVNIYGIGAVVILHTKRQGKIEKQYREVSSYQHTSDKNGCKEDRIIFGLGQQAIPKKVVIRWPNGVQQKRYIKGWTFLGVMKPIQLAYFTVGVKHRIPFGKSFPVSFNYSGNTRVKEYDWIGIWEDDETVSIDEYPEDLELALWTYICKSQLDVLSTVSNCLEHRRFGSVTFGVADSVIKYDQQWPIRPGKYRTCLVTYKLEVDKEEKKEKRDVLIGSCKKFSVKLDKKKQQRMVQRAKITPTKKLFAFGETISATFKTPVKIHNSWVGIFPLEDYPPKFNDLGSKYMWVYTGCNNVLGDQDESNDCASTKREGVVTFDKSNTGNASIDWPLPGGEYYMVISFHNNRPYSLYKAAAKKYIFVVN